MKIRYLSVSFLSTNMFVFLALAEI